MKGIGVIKEGVIIEVGGGFLGERD